MIACGVTLLVLCGLRVPWYQTPTTKLIEYPLWAAAFGVIVGLLFRRYLRFKPPTELLLKVGLILMGLSVNVRSILSVGSRGVLQAVVMIACVFAFTWWLGGKLKLGDTLRAVMSTAVSVCGVSAAIAAAGAVQAKKQELTYITALVILTALPLMVLMPLVAGALGMPAAWAGAWFGGNIDTTAAVVGAGTMYGPEAAKIASIVKLSQNALIGVVAFLLALAFAVKTEGKRPSAAVIWQRFPKFVLGFVAASVIATLGLISKADLTMLKNAQNWFLAAAFICIGMELRFDELRKMGGRPLAVYLGATVFNTLLAFGVSWVLFAR